MTNHNPAHKPFKEKNSWFIFQHKIFSKHSRVLPCSEQFQSPSVCQLRTSGTSPLSEPHQFTHIGLFKATLDGHFFGQPVPVLSPPSLCTTACFGKCLFMRIGQLPNVREMVLEWWDKCLMVTFIFLRNTSSIKYVIDTGKHKIERYVKGDWFY